MCLLGRDVSGSSKCTFLLFEMEKKTRISPQFTAIRILRMMRILCILRAQRIQRFQRMPRAVWNYGKIHTRWAFYGLFAGKRVFYGCPRRRAIRAKHTHCTCCGWLRIEGARVFYVCTRRCAITVKRIRYTFCGRLRIARTRVFCGCSGRCAIAATKKCELQRLLRLDRRRHGNGQRPTARHR